MREYFSQIDERNAPPRIPVMVNMTSASVPASKGLKLQSAITRSQSLDQINAVNKNTMMDEDSDEDEDYQMPEDEVPLCLRPSLLICSFSTSIFLYLLLIEVKSFQPGTTSIENDVKKVGAY